MWTTSWTMMPYLPLRSRGVCRSAALVMAVALHASSVAAQQPDAICPACTVTVEELAVLGTEASGARLAFSPSGAFHDSRGRFWISPVGDPPLVFDENGRFLSAVGKASLEDPAVYERDDGFLMPGAFFEIGDSVGVIDLANPRIKIVGPDLEVVREIRLPGIVRRIHVIEWPVDVIASASVNDPRSSGWPLHRMDLSRRTARVLESFGDNGGQKLFGESSLVGERRTVRARSGSIWGAEVLDYRIHLYATSGHTIRSLDHPRDWFVAESDANDGLVPRPYIGDLGVDHEGRVWVFAKVPREEWRGADGRMLEDQSEVWHTRVEVLAENGRDVITSRDLDGLVLYATGPDTAAMYEFDEGSGRHLVRIVRFEISGAAPESGAPMHP